MVTFSSAKPDLFMDNFFNWGCKGVWGMTLHQKNLSIPQKRRKWTGSIARCAGN
jgi:hypothetical protein